MLLAHHVLFFRGDEVRLIARPWGQNVVSSLLSSLHTRWVSHHKLHNENPDWMALLPGRKSTQICQEEKPLRSSSMYVRAFGSSARCFSSQVFMAFLPVAIYWFFDFARDKLAAKESHEGLRREPPLGRTQCTYIELDRNGVSYCSLRGFSSRQACRGVALFFACVLSLGRVHGAFS